MSDYRILEEFNPTNGTSKFRIQIKRRFLFIPYWCDLQETGFRGGPYVYEFDNIENAKKRIDALENNRIWRIHYTDRVENNAKQNKT